VNSFTESFLTNRTQAVIIKVKNQPMSPLNR